MDILDYIPTGRENAITRVQLCTLTGLTDRAVRALIEIARSEGAVIINNQDGKGYYISNEPAEIRRQIAQNNSRAMSILRQQKFLRKRLTEIEQGAVQITMEEDYG